MPKHQDSLFRQWHMLRLVPRYPQKITVQAVQRTLLGEGFEVTERTVQRDLQELSNVFPLVVDDREKPYGWSWQKDAANFDLPGLTVPEALTLVMAEQHLGGLLPTSIVEQLRPYFDSAKRRLDAEPMPHHSRSWLSKVRTIPPTQPLIPPAVDAGVQAVISDALLHERQVEIRYLKRGEQEPVEYRIHPLGMVQRGAVIYLDARLFDYPDARTLVLHRIQSASLLDARVVVPKGYSFDARVKSGVWDFGAGESISVVLRFSPSVGTHLLETPLSADQEILELPDGGLEIRATIPDTPQLEWWLLGFGGGVEVMAPPALRSSIRATVEDMLNVYRRD